MMKKCRLFLPMAILLTASFATPTEAAEKLVPFSGSLSANEPAAAGAPAGYLLVNGSGGGIATHLGRFTITWSFTVNLTDLKGSGPLIFTAANGDQIFANSDGVAEPTNTPGVFRVREVFTISGEPDGSRTHRERWSLTA